ncbi:hypothetical protein EDD55_106109 [Varunaivibrio sulfuroxidans]|uniref:Uncharacterized protein n=1 Tax=Varunaivibrio sulfuroxidans TaxID=1773489 RepID=A0A4V2UNI3_9PROT|nr:hypothetical protein EDD55_106109 [Varunaivibrio sulfuroxidans]
MAETSAMALLMGYVFGIYPGKHILEVGFLEFEPSGNQSPGGWAFGNLTRGTLSGESEEKGTCGLRHGTYAMALGGRRDLTSPRAIPAG